MIYWIADFKVSVQITFHATIDIYVSDATDHIPGSETDLTLP
jgi:hypothetical protein